MKELITTKEYNKLKKEIANAIPFECKISKTTIASNNELGKVSYIYVECITRYMTSETVSLEERAKFQKIAYDIIENYAQKYEIDQVTKF